MEEFNLSPDQAQEEAKLLAICKQYQGEYLPAHHGPRSYATEYSWEFVNASCALYRIYSSAELSPLESKWLQRISRGHDGLQREKAKLHEWVLSHMARRFRDTEISSCRATMTLRNVEYLYKAHMLPILKPPSEVSD